MEFKEICTSIIVKASLQIIFCLVVPIFRNIFFILSPFMGKVNNTIDKVKSFVNAITQFDFDFDLISVRYVIDAKSIMGIFSLDLSKPIDLKIHAEDNEDEVMEVIKPYLV